MSKAEKTERLEKKDKYLKGKKRVEEIKGFYGHLSAYVMVNLILLIINLLVSPDELWFHWTAIFWGIGIIWHFLGVFVMHRWTKDWEEKKIKELMERE